VAVNVQDPGNIGAIIRVAEAAGATCALVAGASADPYSWKALRGSMGSALRLPIEVVPDLSDVVPLLRSRDCRIIATVPRDGAAVFDVDMGGSAAVLVGGEGPGLPPSLVDAADERVTIPMQAPVESLNTAVAAAILLYEAHRQRRHRSARPHVVI